MSEENAAVAGDTATPAPESAPEATPQVEADASATTTEATAAADEEKVEDRPKPKSRAQERIDALTRDKRNLERRLARANQELGRVKATPAPREEDYGDANEFTRETIKHAARESAAETTREQAQSEFETLRQQRNEVWAERVAEARATIPDFDNVFTNNVPVSETMAEIIAESDVGIDIAFHLGKNLGLAHRIFEMSPAEAGRELGRLEGKLSAPSAKQVSTAPKPVPTVTGKAHTVAKTYEEMSLDEYYAAREKAERAKWERHTGRKTR